jgi:hypothetical protein
MMDETADPEKDELLSRLVRAGASERPSSRSMSRTLSALGLGATTLGIATSAGAIGAAGPVGTLTLAVIGKWASLGLASGVVVASVAHGVARLPSSPSMPSPAPQISASPAIVPSSSSSSVAFSAPPSPLGTSLPPPVGRLPSSGSGRTDVAVRAPLAAELVLVDRGRALLQGGSPRAALSALDRYERDFAGPRLLPEVLYLRMEALEQLGMTAQATAIARQLAQGFPRSPHAARARRVLTGRT